MAKLNITFVNEVGNNLNRYKAIDVNTGDEYLFDLSRNGTITTPGTPLNAEIMNAIVSAINEHFSNLVVAINDTTPSDTKYPSEKAVVDYVGQIANEESVDVSDNVLIKISGVSDNLALPPESQMEVNSIEGNSVVVNQYIPNNKKTYSNVSTDTRTTLQLMVQVLASEQVQYSSLLNVISSAGIYQYVISIPSDINGNILRIKHNGASEDLLFADISMPVIANHKIFLTITLTGVNPSVVGGLTSENLSVIDLTQWFGSNDNIPQDILNTPSNFFKYYKGSLAYDTGHIENGSGNLVDTNRNIWDEEWENGWFNDTTGEFVAGSENIASKNYINVLPNTTYYFNLNISRGYGLYFYDSNKKFISTKWVSSERINTTPTNTYYMKFYVPIATYNHDICINVSDTNFNGTYVSHIKNTLDFGNDILRSAGNVRDKKMPDGEITRKVGSVDLGTLDWGYDSSNAYFNSNGISSLINKPTTNSSIANIVCSKYNSATWNNTAPISTGVNLTISINATTGNIGIRDTSYTDTATFKTAMSGVYLNYELATPTIEQGTPYDNHIPVYYGGQEYLTGDVPFVINKNYDISIKDQVLTNVRVDKEQSEQIHALESVNSEQSNAIDSLQNKVSNLETTQEAHSTSINSLNTKITDLENYKFDSSKLTIEQNLVNTILKYNNVEIDRIENLDVAYLPNIVFDVYQDTQFTAQEKVTITNSTDMDMYVSIKGLKEHNNLSVPFGESVTSQLTASIESSLPNSYIATIEIKIYYNPKTNYNATTGYTVFENVKTINLRATVHPTDR